MIREEAIEILGCIYMEVSTDEDKEAVDMGIKALKERPHGEWVQQYKNDGKWHDMGYFDHMYKCSKCGSDGSQRWHFCPNCGASMQANDRQVTGKLQANEERGVKRND